MGKIAIIDMGTNTFHLLLAEIGGPNVFRITYRNHAIVKIGKGGINEGVITTAAFQRALEAMAQFKSEIDRHGITEVYAYGTSAIRNATNGGLLTEAIASLTGISVKIISGDEEAGLIFRGIQSGLELGSTTSLVMDIGAGSVEFIIGDSVNILWKRSFEIGGQRLLEKFMRHDPIAVDEMVKLDTYFHDTLRSLLEKLHEYKPTVLVGSSGSFDTLSEIFCIRSGMHYNRGAPETPLTVDGFYDIFRDLIQNDRAGRMNIPGMIEMRVEMIVVASCLIRFILEGHRFEAIRVSTYSLKEGALATIAASKEAF